MSENFLNEIKEESSNDLDSYFDTNTEEETSYKNTKSSNKLIINYGDNKRLIDTIFDGEKTGYLEYNKESNVLYKKNSVMIHGVKYEPIQADSNYIVTNTILFPAMKDEYLSKEQLINDIRAFIHKYVDIQEELEIICVYYVIMTYFYNKFTEVPYLRVVGDYGSGKSRFLKTIGSLCYNPIMVNGGISTSALFRIIDTVKGTLVFDEADLKQSDTTNEVVKILNNGFQKGLPILRADGDKFEPKAYDVFGPKIIGSREDFKDQALESRCITFVMKKSTRSDLPINLDNTFLRDAQSLRNKLLSYRYDNHNEIELISDRIDGLEARLNQIINPLLSLCINDDDKAVIVMNSFNYQETLIKDRFLSIEGQIFKIIMEISQTKNDISYTDIINELDLDYKLNPRKLGSIIKNHGIDTERTNKGFRINIMNNKTVIEKFYVQYGITQN